LTIFNTLLSTKLSRGNGKHNLFQHYSIFTKQSSLKKGTHTQISKRYQIYRSSVTSKSSRLEEVYHRS